MPQCGMNFFMINFAETPGAHTHSVTKMNKRNQLLDDGQIKVTVVNSDNDRSKDVIVRPKLRGLIPGDVLSYCGHYGGRYGRFFYFMDGKSKLLAGNPEASKAPLNARNSEMNTASSGKPIAVIAITKNTAA